MIKRIDTEFLVVAATTLLALWLGLGMVQDKADLEARVEALEARIEALEEAVR